MCSHLAIRYHHASDGLRFQAAYVSDKTAPVVSHSVSIPLQAHAELITIGRGARRGGDGGEGRTLCMCSAKGCNNANTTSECSLWAASSANLVRSHRTFSNVVFAGMQTSAPSFVQLA